MVESNAVEIKLAQGPVFGENNMVLQSFYAAPTDTPKPAAPFPPVEFLGREKALAEVVTQLGGSGQPGIVAVWGVAGVGKSALASAAAASLRDRFPDGCVWCDLRQAGRDRRTALDNIAWQVGQDPRSFLGLEPLKGRVRSVLAAHKMLIVLDNVAGTEEIEHLVDAANPASTPILITTRSRQVAMELAASSLELGPLPKEDSRVLLREVSRLPDDPVVDQLVEATGGIPLLIQAIGRQIRRTRPKRRDATVANLAKLLKDSEYRLGLLEGDVSYRDVLLLNYESLGPAAKSALRLMGVLGMQPIRVEMIREILGLGREEVDEAIESLVDLALGNEGQDGRIGLSADVHALAKELANDAGNAVALRARAAEYLKSWLEREPGTADLADYTSGFAHCVVLIEDCLARNDWDRLGQLTRLGARATYVAGHLGMIYATSWPLASLDVSLGDHCYLDRVDWVGARGGDLQVSNAWVRKWRLAGARIGDLKATDSTLAHIDMRGIRAGDLVFNGCNLEALDLRGARFGDLVIHASRATGIALDDARCGNIVIHDSVVSDTDFTTARYLTLVSTGNGYLIECRLVQGDTEGVEPNATDDRETCGTS